MSGFFWTVLFQSIGIIHGYKNTTREVPYHVERYGKVVQC